MCSAPESPSEHEMATATLNDRTRGLIIQENRTQANQQLSPLLRLPAELRHRIYELVYDNAVVVADTFIASSAWPYLFTGFLHTCRQINYEATPVFYKHCTFDFPFGIQDSMHRRLRLEKLQLLCSVQFSTPQSLGWLVRESVRLRESKTLQPTDWCSNLGHCHIGCVMGGPGHDIYNGEMVAKFTKVTRRVFANSCLQIHFFDPKIAEPLEPSMNDLIIADLVRRLFKSLERSNVA